MKHSLILLQTIGKCSDMHGRKKCRWAGIPDHSICSCVICEGYVEHPHNGCIIDTCPFNGNSLNLPRIENSLYLLTREERLFGLKHMRKYK